eukprot:9279565-Alexandrium_andersonii.AAC.1
MRAAPSDGLRTNWGALRCACGCNHYNRSGASDRSNMLAPVWQTKMCMRDPQHAHTTRPIDAPV